MMDWYDKVIVNKPGSCRLRCSEDRWPSIHKWCPKHGIEQDFDPPISS